MARFRSTVGTKRISGSARPSVAGATRDVRTQMAQIQKNLEKAINTIDKATPQAVVFALQPIFDESQRLVPVKTGDLKRSGYLEIRTTPGRGSQAEIGYGRGGRPFYAVFVHEMIGLRHDPPTQAKFLQQPLEAQMDQIPKRMADFMRTAFRF